MSVRRFSLPAIALTALLAGTTTACLPSSGDDTKKTSQQPPGEALHGDEHGGQGISNATSTGADTPASGTETYFAAALNGANEVPGADGKAVGDKDGKATALVRVKGDQVSFAVSWEGTGAPTAAHLHLGGKGANGAVKVPFFASALPDTARATTGSVKVTDKAVLDDLVKNPGGFYFNLHTGEFPGGAVRGQLTKLAKPVDLDSVLKKGPLTGPADGAQEVDPGNGKQFGDKDGKADTSVKAWQNCIEYAYKWSNVAPPTLGHVHKAEAGKNGDVVAPLFDAGLGLPQSITGLSGIVEVDPALVDRINKNPANYYTNLHTAEFPGGAVRGQLSKGEAPKAVALNAAVVKGVQIYACTPKQGGGTEFTQHDVSAVLRGDIKHSFVQKNAGPPQWIAPDGSSVTGKVVTKTPNGDKNIPELVLDATQTGKPAGVLSAATQILRLNTHGGVAPAGACDAAAQPTVEVPYGADYLFLG
jgi:hypothetical protein